MGGDVRHEQGLIDCLQWPPFRPALGTRNIAPLVSEVISIGRGGLAVHSAGPMADDRWGVNVRFRGRADRNRTTSTGS